VAGLELAVVKRIVEAHGITIPKNAEHPALAAQFVEFVLGPKSWNIMEANGQTMITPV
jgi:ABC-type molybdate transport system substrate-binding protein